MLKNIIIKVLKIIVKELQTISRSVGTRMSTNHRQVVLLVGSPNLRPTNLTLRRATQEGNPPFSAQIPTVLGQSQTPSRRLLSSRPENVLFSVYYLYRMFTINSQQGQGTFIYYFSSHANIDQTSNNKFLVVR